MHSPAVSVDFRRRPRRPARRPAARSCSTSAGGWPGHPGGPAYWRDTTCRVRSSWTWTRTSPHHLGQVARHPLPDPDGLQCVLRAAGVRHGQPGRGLRRRNGSIAARLWWLLRWAGHERVAILDGGFAGWQTSGLEVTTEIPAPSAGDIEVRPGAMPVLDAAAAAELARSGVLLDARAPERYRGDVEPVDPRAGHVPGALNAPFAGARRRGEVARSERSGRAVRRPRCDGGAAGGGLLRVRGHGGVGRPGAGGGRGDQRAGARGVVRGVVVALVRRIRAGRSTTGTEPD